MSCTLNHVLSTWKDVLTQLRRKSICWKGIPLSERDALTYTEAIVLWCIALIDISSPYGCLCPEREYIGWATRVASLDVAALSACLSDCIGLLRSTYKPMRPSWFKRQLGGTYPFLGMLLSPIKVPLDSFLRNPNAVDFTFCYQFLSFITHLSLQDLAIDLENEYVELEQTLVARTYDPVMLFELNDIMRGWLAGLTISESNYRPKHGPGAVAESPRSAGSLAKYSVLSTDALLSYFCKHEVGVSVESFAPFSLKELDRTSVLVQVPKSLKTLRTISTEPAALAYHQQAVWRVCKDYIHAHRYLSSHINFGKQELNGELALAGSIDGDLATIDLSSASDMVTTALVKAVFRGTSLYSALVALRSNCVKLPSGRVLRVAKYAPMGSALCFLVETLIFAVLAEYAERRTSAKWGFQSSRWRVYGDDIIVEDPFFWDLIAELQAAGFKTNVSKSYSRPYRFRESCGYEGYDGVEVTPLKISRKFLSVSGAITSCHASLFEGLVDMANSAYRYKMPLLRAYVVQLLLNNVVGVPLFSGNDRLALYSPCPDNYRAPYRPTSWDKPSKQNWYQREEVQVVVGGTRPLKQTETGCPITFWVNGGYSREWVDYLTLESARYFDTLRLSENRTGDMFEPSHLICVPRGPSVPILQKRWVEKPIAE